MKQMKIAKETAYHSRNGAVYAKINGKNTLLSLEQIDKSGITIHEIKNFNNEKFVEYYQDQL